MSREQRKLEHINLSLNLPDGPVSTGLEDIRLIHSALPNLALDEVDICIKAFNKNLKAPLIINAITGGVSESKTINAALARIARETGVAMAVGSQTAALHNRAVRDTFKIVREINSDGLIFANVGAHVEPKKAKEAVHMIEADALQVHLNVAQELIMPEGDRSFKGYLTNILKMADYVEVPIIVKEVGFGISREVATKLYNAGIRNIDLGGAGGTNFAAIEGHRGKTSGYSEISKDIFTNWGIPTAASIVEVTALKHWDNVIATGGIRNALHCIKALSLGANLVGIAGSFLKVLLQKSELELKNTIENLTKELRMLMVLTGSSNLAEIHQLPIIITGETREWLEVRGYDIKYFAKR